MNTIKDSIKLTRKYPSDPKARYSKDPKLVGDDNADLDAAIREPVHILNKVLGYKSFASCEGHKSVKNPYLKPLRSSSHCEILHGPPYSSYIGFYLPLQQYCPLVDFLISKGFEEVVFGYMVRGGLHVCDPDDSHEYIKTDSGRVLIFFTEGALEGDCYKTCINVSPENMPKSQSEWDKLRDDGWEIWLSLLNEFNNIFNE